MPLLLTWDPNVKYNFIIDSLRLDLLEEFKALPFFNKKLYSYQNFYGRSFLLCNINPNRLSVDLTDLLNQDECELEIFKREVYDSLLVLLKGGIEFRAKKVVLRSI